MDSTKLNTNKVTDPADQKPHKLPGILITLVILLVLLLGSTVYFASQVAQLKKQLITSKTTPSPTPTPVSGQPWDVKTYTSKTYGVSFQYPGDLNVREFKDFGISLWKSPVPDAIPFEAPFPPVHIMMLPSKAAIDAWIPQIQILRHEQAKIGQENVTVTVGIIPPGPYYTDDVIYYTYIQKNNVYYLFRLDEGQYKYVSNFYQLILSTFTFEGASPTPATTFTCPPNGYVDCMPVITPEKEAACSPAAIAWYKSRCPGFKGGAL